MNGRSILNLQHGDIISLIKDAGYVVTLTIGAPLMDEADIPTRPESECSQDEVHMIELHRGTTGFGFSIRGGREFMQMPHMFVLRIAEGGTAAHDGRLRIGDQILEINGLSTREMAHAMAIDMIKRGGTVRLAIRRPVGGQPLPSPSTASTQLPYNYWDDSMQRI